MMLGQALSRTSHERRLMRRQLRLETLSHIRRYQSYQSAYETWWRKMLMVVYNGCHCSTSTICYVDLGSTLSLLHQELSLYAARPLHSQGQIDNPRPANTNS